MDLNRSLHRLFVLFSLWICSGLFFASPAPADDQRVLDAPQMYRLYKQFIFADIPFPAADLEISNFASRPETLALPPGEIKYLYDMGPMTGRLGLRTFTVDVLVNGIQAGSVKMVGDVQLYGSVLSAARTLKRDTVLAREDLKLTRRNITMLGPDIIQDPAGAIGQELKTTLQPGSILFSSLLKAPRVIKRGDMVVILAESGGIRVSVTGKARSSGGQGDLIKVKNMMSRKEIYAKIINQDQVQVEF